MRDEVIIDGQSTLDMSSTWWRNRNGDVIHTPDCRHAVNPWPYAEGWSLARLKHYLDTCGWVKACKHCQPLKQAAINERKETT